MKIIKNENDKFYSDITDNRNRLTYGRAAYEKATENEKKIAIGSKKQIDCINAIVEKESIKGLKGETVEKAIKFNSAGGIIEVEVSVESEVADSQSSVKAYLNGRLIGPSSGGGVNHGLFSMRSKDGENLLLIIVDGVYPHSDITVTVNGKVEKCESSEEIDCIGKNFYAVRQDDKIVIYRYTGEEFEWFYTLCGVKCGSATYNPDKGYVYVSAKFYSGKTAIYEIWDDGETIGVLDDTVDFGSGGLYYDGYTLWFYFVVGGALYYTVFDDDMYLKPRELLLKGIKEATVFKGATCALVLVRDFHDRYSVCKAADIIKLKTYIGPLCCPHIPYGNPDIIICKNGSETSAANGCYTVSVKGTSKVGKPYMDRYPVTLSEDYIVGLENGKPIILGKNLNE